MFFFFFHLLQVDIIFGYRRTRYKLGQGEQQKYTEKDESSCYYDMKCLFMMTRLGNHFHFNELFLKERCVDFFFFFRKLYCLLIVKCNQTNAKHTTAISL